MRRIGLSIVSATVLAACATSGTVFDEVHLPPSQYDAGLVSISAMPPIWWPDIAEELNPRFSSARANVEASGLLATTQRDLQEFQRARRVMLEAEFAGAVQNYQESTTTTQSGNEDPETESRRNSIRTLEAVERPQLGGDYTAPTYNSNLPDGSFGTVSSINPIILAHAAVGLHQELNILNHYLDQAYDPRHHDAWLARVRVTLTPYARNQPFDAYVTLNAQFDANGDQGCGGLVSRGSENHGDCISIIPLIVTDNFERSDTRQIQQIADQIRLNSTGLFARLGVGGRLDDYTSRLDALLGAQYNNLLSVYTVSEDTIQVRLGAQLSPTSGYEMQARSFDITFLVVTPNEGTPVAKASTDSSNENAADREPDSGDPSLAASRIHMSLTAESEFRHALTGEVLPPFDAAYDQNGRLRAGSSITGLAERIYGYLVSNSIAWLEFPQDPTSNTYCGLPGSRTSERGAFLSREDVHEILLTINNRSADCIFNLISATDNATGGTLPSSLRNDLLALYDTRAGFRDTFSLESPSIVAPPDQIGSFVDNQNSSLVATISGGDRVGFNNFNPALYFYGPEIATLELPEPAEGVRSSLENALQTNPSATLDGEDPEATNDSVETRRFVGPFMAENLTVTREREIAMSFPSNSSLISWGIWIPPLGMPAGVRPS